MIERNPIDERISGLVRSVRAGVPDALEARIRAEARAEARKAAERKRFLRWTLVPTAATALVLAAALVSPVVLKPVPAPAEIAEIRTEFEIPDTSSNEEFVGKQARFEIDVHEVKTKVLPELNDEFAATAGGFDTLEEYRADVRKGLDEVKESAHMREVEMAAGRELTSRLEGDVPQEMIDGRANSMLRDFLDSLQERGVSIQDYLQMTGITPEKLQDDLKEQAAVRVREELALEALFRAHGLEVTDRDVEDSLREITGGDEKAAEELKASLTVNGALPILREQVMHRKALKWLIDSVIVVEEEQS